MAPNDKDGKFSCFVLILQPANLRHVRNTDTSVMQVNVQKQGLRWAQINLLFANTPELILYISGSHKLLVAQQI